MPVLVIAAENDYTSVDDKRKYSKKIEQARVVVIADSGHATPMDQPIVLNQKISQFLESR